MKMFAVVIATCSLYLAWCAFKKSGGSAQDIKNDAETPGRAAGSFRNRLADILARIEKAVRTVAPASPQPEDHGTAQPPAVTAAATENINPENSAEMARQ